MPSHKFKFTILVTSHLIYRYITLSWLMTSAEPLHNNKHYVIIIYKMIKYTAGHIDAKRPQIHDLCICTIWNKFARSGTLMYFIHNIIVQNIQYFYT